MHPDGPVTQRLGMGSDVPAEFLNESIHEVFDEYYSVALSFWTKMGLREKARQGFLTGGSRGDTSGARTASPIPTPSAPRSSKPSSRSTRWGATRFAI